MKYRAWHKKSKWMCVCDELSKNMAVYMRSDGVLVEVYVDGAGSDSDGCGVFTDDVADEWDVMFSTGLQDKNGVEIFEGDVIKDGIAGEERKFLIYWNDAEACFWAKLISTEIDCYKLGSNFSPRLYCVEIIGNKFENPELLVEKGIKRGMKIPLKTDLPLDGEE